MNTTTIQSSRPGGTVAPLLVHRLKLILSRADLAHLLELEAESSKLWEEKKALGRASRLLDDARALLQAKPTAENRVQLDELVAKFGTPEDREREIDIRESHLTAIAKQVPAAVLPVLHRIIVVLGDVLAEKSDSERKAFEEVGYAYNRDADAGDVVRLIMGEIHRLGELVAKIKRGQYISAQSPSDVFGVTQVWKKDGVETVIAPTYFDLATVNKDELKATLPVPFDPPAPVVPLTRNEQVYRDHLASPTKPGIDRATGRPSVEIPGVDFLQYGGGKPGEINSDGEFSRELARVGVLPSKRI